jgi:phosphomannomutase
MRDFVHKHIFREYDIRGIVGTELLLDEVYALTRAIGAYLIQQQPSVNTIAVARDGRTHSPAIEAAVCQALCDSGFSVLQLGLCPTPVLYFALHKLPVDAGIMITASHNGPAYNGLKINLGTDSVWGAAIQKIRALYEVGAFVASPKAGTIIPYPFIERYVDWLVDHFSHLKRMDRSLVIDCASGATGAVLPLLVRKMGWSSVQLLYAEVDGNFPYHEADPIVEKNVRDLRRAVLGSGADLGIAFDGDGDRMAPLTATGRHVGGDELLVLYAQQVLEAQGPGMVIYDIKCSQLVPDMVKKLKGYAQVSPSGHSIIKSALRTQNAVLAGELSCHFFFADRYFGYDDGIYAFLRLLELLERSGKSLDELLQKFPTFCTSREMRIACAEDQKNLLVAAVKTHFLKKQVLELIEVDGVRVILPEGWGLARASNTQAAICIRCESSNLQDLRIIKEEFMIALMPHISQDILLSEMEL